MLHKFYNSAQALSKKNYNDEDSLVSSNHEFQFVQDRSGFRFRRIDRNGGSDVRKKEISVAPNETPIFLAFFRTTIYFTLKCARVFRELVIYYQIPQVQFGKGAADVFSIQFGKNIDSKLPNS